MNTRADLSSVADSEDRNDGGLPTRPLQPLHVRFAEQHLPAEPHPSHTLLPNQLRPRTHGRVELPLPPEMVQAAREAVSQVTYDYSQLYQDLGIAAVVDCAWRASGEAGYPFTKDTFTRKLSSLEAWRRFGVPLLASSPKEITQYFYESSIPYAHDKLKNVELIRIFNATSNDPEGNSAWVQRYGMRFAPHFYARYLVDDEGNSPTPREFRQIVFALRGYVSGKSVKQNTMIDTQSRPWSTEEDIEQGYHHFLQGDQRRAQALLTFCFAIHKRFESLPPQARDSPLPIPLKYVGFARSARDRSMNYSDGRGASWLMDLTEHVCRYLYEMRKIQKYSCKEYVICFPTSLEECQIGEELWTRSGMAYANTGTGFGIQDAGVNVHSGNITGMPFGDVGIDWASARAYRNLHFFKENMDAEALRTYKYEGYIKDTLKTIEQDNIKAKARSDRRRRLCKIMFDALNDEMEALEKDPLARAREVEGVYKRVGPAIHDVADALSDEEERKARSSGRCLIM